MFLASVNDKIRLTTSAAVNIDVHASFSTLGGSTVTPGVKNTPISTATTTDIVLSPGSGEYRSVKKMIIRNRSTTTACDVTVIHTDGTNAMELYKATIGPGGHLHYNDETGFFVQSQISLPGDPWAGAIMAAMRDGNPNYAMSQMQLAGNVAPTPTNISTTIARCELFRPAYDITVNRMRWYGVGAVAAIYTVALYNFATGARITAQQTITTAANTWGSADVTGTSLVAGTLYAIAVGANATGTTAGIGAIGGTTAAATGQIATAPNALPGNLDSDVSDISSYRFQIGVTAGALPATLPSPQAPAAWTGGMPAFWLDNNTAA